MDQKKLLLLVGAAIVALVTALAARNMMTTASAPVVQAAQQIVVPKGPRVLVAQRALPAGTIITADAVSYQEWPRDMVRDAYFEDGKSDMQKLIGTVVRYPISAGQPLTQGSLVAPGDRGFLAAALMPGMRAVTINVNENTGVAGFVFPGDHVDLMLTSTIDVNATAHAGPVTVTDNRPLNTTETILRNLRVLATDQNTAPDTTDGKTNVRVFHSVTLEVTPRVAEEIQVAQKLGSISLTLRSLADNQQDLDRAIATGQMQLGKDGKPLPSPAAPRQVSSGNDGPPVGFVTGGDVSRFQRKAGSARAGLMGGSMVRNTVTVSRGSSSSTVMIGRNGQAIGNGGSGMAGEANGMNGATAQGVGQAGEAVGNTVSVNGAM